MKRGDAPLLTKVMIGIIVGIVMFVVFISVFGDVLDVLFNRSSWECKQSESGFNLINQYVLGFIDGNYGETKEVLINLQYKCSIVSFSPGIDSIVETPTECRSKSCLCLCYQGKGEDDHQVSGGDCKRHNFCHVYPSVKSFSDEEGKQVIVDGNNGLVSFFMNEYEGRIIFTNVINLEEQNKEVITIERSEDLDQSIYTKRYRLNPSYNSIYQQTIVSFAEEMDVPPQIPLAIAKVESGFNHFEDDGKTVLVRGGSDYGIMQINRNEHDYCFIPIENGGIQPDDNNFCGHSDSCHYKNVLDLNCNIEAAIRLLKESYDSCPKTKEEGVEKYPKYSESCHGFQGYYYGWDCALRKYNGLGCHPTIKSGDYVRRVREEIKNFIL